MCSFLTYRNFPNNLWFFTYENVLTSLWIFEKKLNERASEHIEMQKLILTYTRSYCLKTHSYCEILLIFLFSLVLVEKIIQTESKSWTFKERKEVKPVNLGLVSVLTNGWQVFGILKKLETCLATS